MTGRRSQVGVRRSAGPTKNPLASGVPSFRARRPYNKFNVAPKSDRTWNGILFASKGEMERHLQLLTFEGLGRISDLERQVSLLLAETPDGKPLLKWIVDWSYAENGRIIVEDFTGKMTSKKLMNMRFCAALYPEYVIRISKTEGKGRNKRIVAFDCVNGKLPAVRKKKTTVGGKA